MGNDGNDHDCMEFVGLSVAPADAHPSINSVTMWKMSNNGGSGAVRELADALLFTGQRVVPNALLADGFRFSHSTLEEALRNLLLS
jgi:3-deoxy-D-manno-octulosonate 8-phosphate phosphatase KdsC-like HAD superfamily phosphatase